MRILVGLYGGKPCAGVIASSLGNTVLYLAGATANTGLESRASYALHWRVVETAKREGLEVCDLNGINPTRNPGTYRFKRDLAGKHGRDVCFAGRFDAYGNIFSAWCMQAADLLRQSRRLLRDRHRAA